MNNSATKQPPLISIIMPTYNHAKYIMQAINSVLAQTYTNFELIIIDNHSTDGTENIIASYDDSRIQYFKVKNFGSIAFSRNFGSELARGDFLAFLDSDDFWKKEKLELCISQLKNGIDFIYHDMRIYKAGWKSRKKLKIRNLRKPIFLDLILNGNPIATSSVLIKRELFIGCGGMDTSKELIGVEDYLTWIKVARITESFIYLRSTLGSYRIHDAGISKLSPENKEVLVVNNFLNELTEAQKNVLNSRLLYYEVRKKFPRQLSIGHLADLTYIFIHGNYKYRLRALTLLFFSPIAFLLILLD